MRSRRIILLASAALLLCASTVSPSAKAPVAADTSVDPTANESQKTPVIAEQHEFQAEVSRLMHILINSVYKSKEIFLRELISNASDALDKIRFLALTNKDLDNTADLKVEIIPNKSKKTLTIRDTGIGMTKEELKTNLGTLAKSGTADFLKALEKGDMQDMGLIGQFGVGFYSSFLVADQVEVRSRHHSSEETYVWQSSAAGSFTITPEKEGNGLEQRGTEIVLHLKAGDDQTDFLDQALLKDLVQKYSEFIDFPIYLWTERTEFVKESVKKDEEEEKEQTKKIEEKQKEVEDEMEDKTEKPDHSKDDDEAQDKVKSNIETAEEAEIEEEEKEEMKKIDEEKEEETKTVERKFHEFEMMNTQKPIWLRDPKNITNDDYVAFYKSLTKGENEPLAWTHFKAEGGDVTFRALVYIPKKPDTELFRAVRDVHKNVKLYIRRVFITDELSQEQGGYLPKWLMFVHVVIDSDDLPLNVSRETLQQHKALMIIKKKIISKVIDRLQTMSENEPADFDQFMEKYGDSIKLGAIEDGDHRRKLLKLIRFHSSHTVDATDGTPGNKTSLDDYIARMRPKQKDIYFLTGMNLNEIRASPFVEKIVARGYEVIFMDEPIDEYIMRSITEYDRHRFQSAAKKGLKFGDESESDEEQLKANKEKFKPLSGWIKEVLGSSIGDGMQPVFKYCIDQFFS